MTTEPTISEPTEPTTAEQPTTTPQITQAQVLVTLDHEQTTIVYRTAGTGHPLLLLHGWGGSSRYWQNTLLRLADIRTVYALDLPGHGDSPPLQGTITPTRIAEIVAGFADALDLDTYDLNGHSYSATVAAYIAVGWDDRVRRLLMTCPSTFRDEKERHLVTRVHKIAGLWVMLRGSWMGRYPTIYKRIARALFYNMPMDDREVQESINDFLRMDRHTGIQLPLNATMPDYLKILQRVPEPTLVVGARKDSIMPAYGPPTVANLIRNSRLAWIDSCGHLPMVERPQVYHHILREFLMDEESQAYVV